MISERDIAPVVIYTSRSPKSTGGVPNVALKDTLEVLFDKTSSFYGKTVYRFLYAVCRLETNESFYKIKLSYSIDISQVLDKYDIYFLKNIEINFFVLDRWKKNYILELYDEFGYSSKSNKHISEHIEKKGKSLEVSVGLSRGDFFPIGLEISLNGPTERIYKLPIVLKIKSYAI
jgi:hypothetical protein